MASLLKLAEAQFIGYHFGKDNAGIIPLVEGMGLKLSEWKKIKVTMHDWISSTDVAAIDDYFEKRRRADR